MKILHIITNYDSKGFYQENYLSKGHFELGHEVSILSTNRSVFNKNYNSESKLVHDEDYGNVDVIRLKKNIKLSSHQYISIDFRKAVIDFQPDLIFCHGFTLFTMQVFALKKFILRNKIKLYFDVHTTFDNSYKTKSSKFMHKNLFRFIINRNLKIIDKVFYVAPECKDFIDKVYGLPSEMLSHLPLGGDSRYLSQYDEVRDLVRTQLNVCHSDIVVFHTGKIPQRKKTYELINYLKNYQGIKLFLVGKIEDNHKDKIINIIDQSSNIKFLGFKEPTELHELFCAGDLYIQYGSLSNTFIEAICCGLPIIVHDVPQTRFLTSYQNGMLINAEFSIEDAIKHIVNNRDEIDLMKKNCKEFARELDYLSIAKKSLDVRMEMKK